MLPDCVGEGDAEYAQGFDGSVLGVRDAGASAVQCGAGCVDRVEIVVLALRRWSGRSISGTITPALTRWRVRPAPWTRRPRRRCGPGHRARRSGRASPGSRCVWLGSFSCPTLFRRRRCRRRLGVLCPCRRRRRRGGEFILVSDFRDGLIKAITSVQGFRDGFDGEVVGQSQGRGIEALLIEPAHVGLGPGISAAVTEPLAYQQSGDPVPGPHQVPAGIFSDPDQIQDCFLSGIRDGDLGDLVQFSSRARCRASFLSVFTRSPDGRWSLDGGATRQSMPASRRALARTKPVGRAS